ncbi:MAG: alpha/beta fold hydrolase [Sphingomonas phyllosphaerae]|uniref:alpha/beta fold hydrolase n=1 Tax=Sphingomonas phyllosphaerae TaxID=257003 RepID=UPI002FFC39E5
MVPSHDRRQGPTLRRGTGAQRRRARGGAARRVGRGAFLSRLRGPATRRTISPLHPVRSTGLVALAHRRPAIAKCAAAGGRLETLRQALGIDRMTILAHSMGTFLAMSYAQAHPRHVAKLFLTGALPAKSPPGGWDAYSEASTSDARAHLTGRPEVERERAAIEASIDPVAARKATHLWRIGLAAVNMYHVERWREMLGGQA